MCKCIKCISIDIQFGYKQPLQKVAVNKTTNYSGGIYIKIHSLSTHVQQRNKHVLYSLHIQTRTHRLRTYVPCAPRDYYFRTVTANMLVVISELCYSKSNLHKQWSRRRCTETSHGRHWDSHRTQLCFCNSCSKLTILTSPKFPIKCLLWGESTDPSTKDQ